jgi:hypothetical protein
LCGICLAHGFQAYNYQLVYVDQEKIYYTIIPKDGELYFGTNKGIYVTNEGLQPVAYNLNVEGPINMDLAAERIKIQFKSAPESLPLGEYKDSITSIQSFQNYIYVVSRGILFVFKNKPYAFMPFESVRSISANYIGSYGGIYFKNEILNYPLYTNGQIKEYDDITFICYDGLFAIQGDQKKIVYDAPVGNRKYGALKNIFRLENDSYIIVSDTGLYRYNHSDNRFQLIYESGDSAVIPLRLSFRDGYEFKPGFWFGQKNNLYRIDLSNDEVSNMYSFDAEIIDFVRAKDLVYIITNDGRMTTLYSDNHQTFVVNTLSLLSRPHTIEFVDSYLFLSGDDGLSIYDIVGDQLHYLVISDEFNRGAVYKKDNSISIGSIHGVYQFENIDLLVDTISGESYVLNEAAQDDRLFIVLVILLGCIGLIFAFKQKNKSYNNQEMVVAIKKYIDSNLQKVDVVSIAEKFKIDNNLLYHLDPDFRPGEYIKQKRKEKAIELFSKGTPIEKVAKATGYSVSYLKRYF